MESSNTKEALIDAELSEDGVEVEVETPVLVDEIKRPYDPEKIRIRTVPAIVELLVSRIRYGEIDLAPEFQRQAGIWDQKRKSRLIESLLLRIPIPVFYVAENADEHWSVVDGLQRMSTIYSFVSDGFKLKELEYLTQLEGKLFSDLPRPMQRRINETQFIVNVIEHGTPDELIFNVFSRINTGGMPLNGQEIRHALIKGPVRDYLQELAGVPEFLEATAHSIKPGRMADRELALRFIAFYTEPPENYTTNDLDGFLHRAMTRVNAFEPSDRDDLKRQFKRAMTASYKIFGDDAFRKRYDLDSQQRRPISKPLFEAWSVALATLTDDQIETLIERREDVRKNFVDLMNDNREFDVAISTATGVPTRVATRFTAIKELIDGFL